jgi:hypothetical protein
MSSGLTKDQIAYKFRKLAKKYPGSSWRMIRASNGECAFIRMDKPKNGRQSDEHQVSSLRGG